MPEFKDAFTAYGADYQSTMNRFMGNEAMYLKFLNMLFQDKNLQKLGDTLKSGDLEGAFEAAHTLKGVSGNLGLTPLFEAVCAITEPLRMKDLHEDYTALYKAIQDEFQRVSTLLIPFEGGQPI